MKAFRVTGKFRMGHIVTPFTLETIAADGKAAEDRIFSLLGSRHRVNRHQVAIEKVVELRSEQVTDLAVQKMLSMVK